MTGQRSAALSCRRVRFVSRRLNHSSSTTGDLFGPVTWNGRCGTPWCMSTMICTSTRHRSSLPMRVITSASSSPLMITPTPHGYWQHSRCKPAYWQDRSAPAIRQLALTTSMASLTRADSPPWASSKSLIHTYDAVHGLDRASTWRPPDNLAAPVLSRLFPHTPAGELGSAADVLLYMCGRAPLGDLPRLSDWRWYGAVPDSGPPEPPVPQRHA